MNSLQTSTIAAAAAAVLQWGTLGIAQPFARLGTAEPSAGAQAEQAPTGQDPREVGSAVLERSFAGKITSVSRDEQLVTVEDRTLGTQRLRITENSKLKRGSENATWGDLQVGAPVNGVTRGVPGEAQVDWLEVGR
jgi:hypothetical protein